MRNQYENLEKSDTCSLDWRGKYQCASASGRRPAADRDGPTVTSAKKSVLGKEVYNDKNEKIGSILDLVISPDTTVSAAIIATGGFLGVATHDVAVPIGSLDIRNGNFYLAGATKEALKDTPEFQYSKVQAPPKPRKIQAQQL
jgi:sporulation protein YlmC with PRC-barrel domain